MKSTLHSFGCSFSYPHCIPETKLHVKQLAEYLHLHFKSYAVPAICNDEIYSRFLSNIDKFKSNDFIVYQFTFPSRKGFVDLEGRYTSSAGFFNDVDIFRNPHKSGDIDKQKLLDFLLLNSDFIDKSLFFIVYRVVKLLKYLHSEKNINFRLLFICDEYNPIIKSIHSYTPPEVNNKHFDISERFFTLFYEHITFMDEDKVGIVDYIRKNNMTVTQADLHPNEKGHDHIYSKLIKSI